MFLALAIVFSASFVLFGVGSSNSVGLQDILNAAGGGNAADDRQRVVCRPERRARRVEGVADRRRCLGAARPGLPGDRRGSDEREAGQAAQGSYAKAVAAFAKASTLKKNDSDVLKGLAAAYAAQASALQTQVTALQNQAASSSREARRPSTLLPSGLNTPDPVSQAQDSIISQQVTAIQKQIAPLQTASEKATEDAYKTWKRSPS